MDDNRSPEIRALDEKQEAERVKAAATLQTFTQRAGTVVQFPPTGQDQGKKSEQQAQPEKHAFLTTRQFMNTFTAPDYLVDGIIQRGRLYALTSPIGHGKTAVALYLACMIAAGRNMGGIEIEQAPILFLAGENPDDLCARVHGTAQEYGIDPDTLPITFLSGNFPLGADAAELLRKAIDDTGQRFGMIIGDSVAAFFPGDNENDNVQMGAAARAWRVLTKCQGNPALIALSHPVKNANHENLQPRGGGAFIAEIDANLTLWANEDRLTTQLHWQAKIRGPDFSPVSFSLTPINLDAVRDKKGRLFKSVVAQLQTAEAAEKAAKATISDENVVLEQLRRYPGIAVRTIAENAGWTRDGKHNSTKVHRLLNSLKANKLAKIWRGKWQITDAGKAELQGKIDGT
jgi:hypothetical protein